MGFHVEKVSHGLGSRCVSVETPDLSLNWITLLIAVFYFNFYLFRASIRVLMWRMWGNSVVKPSQSVTLAL